jgi:hypothetical protein
VRVCVRGFCAPNSHGPISPTSSPTSSAVAAATSRRPTSNSTSAAVASTVRGGLSPHASPVSAGSGSARPSRSPSAAAAAVVVEDLVVEEEGNSQGAPVVGRQVRRTSIISYEITLHFRAAASDFPWIYSSTSTLLRWTRAQPTTSSVPLSAIPLSIFPTPHTRCFFHSCACVIPEPAYRGGREPHWP